MSAVYSVRFAMVSVGAMTYVVPTAKRAIIKCISGVNSSATANLVSLKIGSFPVVLVSVPAGSSADRSGLHVVLNAGEAMELGAGLGCSAQVSGYLLDAT